MISNLVKVSSDGIRLYRALKALHGTFQEIAEREICIEIGLPLKLDFVQPRQNILQQYNTCPLPTGILHIAMRISPVVYDRCSEPHRASHVLHARLGKVARENIAVAVNSRAGDRITHSNKVVRRNHVPPESGI